jgi:antirestriction protein ArdC
VSVTTDKANNLKDTLTASIVALAAETYSVKQDAAFKTWLASMSRFHRYSWSNQLLIAVQRPDATRVAGFHTWRKMGRFVTKGQKGISIFAPIVRRQDSEAAEEAGRPEAATKGPRRVAGCRGATVFDISQTEGEALPDAPEHNATEGGEDVLPRLEDAAAAFGIRVVYQEIQGSAEGYSMGGTVIVEATQPIPAKCGTLAHEIAHELLHKGADRGTKQQRELEAEATAYVVLAHFGMTSGSRFYLHSYGITGEMLTDSMQQIASAARRIIEQIEGPAQKDEGAEETPSTTQVFAEAA